MKYILNECQFMTLLALADAHKVFSFQMRDSFPEEELVAAVTSLYQLGALEEDRGRMKPAGEYAALIEGMKEAKAVISLHIEEGERLQMLLYPRKDGRVVALESACGYERAVKLSCQDGGALLEDLKENEILPRSFVKDRAQAQELERMAGDEVTRAQGRTLMRIQRVEPVSGAVEETWEVLSAPAMRLLKVSGSKTYTHIYAVHELAAMLEETWKGETS